MKQLFNILGISFILYAFAAILAGNASAQSGCPPYGAECPASSQLVIDKFIRDPSKKGDVYVDNLLLSHYRFTPNEDIFFKIVVRNSGNRVIRNVAIQDYIPVYTNYVNEVAQILPVGTLNPGESRDWYIRVRVKPANEISGGLICGDPNAINKAVARAESQPETWDTASFCVEKKVLGAATQPAAGAELWILAAGLLAMSTIGLIGKRIAQLNIQKRLSANRSTLTNS